MSTENINVEEQVEPVVEVTTPKKTGKRTSRAKKSAAQKEEPVVENAVEKEEPAVKKIIPKDIDINQYVTVRNGFHGKLVYKSNRTGEIFIWDGFGSEQEMELRELKNARNSSKGFFINNWFLFDEDWIIDYLGVRNYYKNAFKIDNFDDIFKLSVDELKETLNGMSDGQKKSIAYRANELIAEGGIDSLKVIATLEESLGVELIEH